MKFKKPLLLALLICLLSTAFALIVTACSNNDDKAKHTHTYTDTVTPATCTEQGYTTHTCVDCNDSYVDTYVDALGHKYREIVIPATCTEQGYTVHKCSRCNDSYADTYVDALGHDYEDSVVEATCTDQGYTTHQCTRCDDSYVDAYVDALDHDYEDSVTDATCTKKGYTTHQCTRCDDSYVDTYVDAKGHDYEDSVVDATCTERGYTLHQCKNCNNSYKDNYTDALGHDFVEGVCTKCNKQELSEGIEYVLSSDETYYIVKSMGTCEDTTVVLKGEIDEIPVKEIATRAFASKTTLTSVVIPEGITKIGNSAFESCTKLVSVTIPASITSIGNNAFMSCSALNGVYITDIVKWCQITFGNADASPISNAKGLYLKGELITELQINDNSLISISDYAFNRAKFTSVTIISSNFTTISSKAFSTCSSLQSAVFSCPKLNYIGSSAFNACTKLKSVTIPSTATTNWSCSATGQVIQLTQTQMKTPTTLATLLTGQYMGHTWTRK